MVNSALASYRATRDLLDDGFAHALKHFGLIG